MRKLVQRAVFAHFPQTFGILVRMNFGHFFGQAETPVTTIKDIIVYPSDLTTTAGMLNSWNGSSFQVSCLRFINTFTRTAASAQHQVQIQCELEEAGFDIPFLKMLNSKVNRRQSNVSEFLNNMCCVDR